jgi:hypothetical protein
VFMTGLRSELAERSGPYVLAAGLIGDGNGAMRTSGGLAGLRIPQQVGGWLSRNQDRLLEAIDPVSDAEDGPRAPLDALLDSGMSQQ